MRQRGLRKCVLLSSLLAGLGMQSLAASQAILAGAGDIAKCGSRLDDAEATAKVLDEIFKPLDGKSPEGVAFTLGDNVYPKGRAQEFRDCYDTTWGRHKHRTRPAAGNHDYKTKNGKAYFDYFGDKAGERDKGYYSYDLAGWKIIAINTNCRQARGCGPGSPQYEWLRQELENSPPCLVAYGHHPRFSSGRHGAEKDMHPLFQLLYQHNADLYIAGHDHNYERFAPQDPSGRPDPERGVRQFVVGTGGREHRKVGRPSMNSEIIDRTSFGILKLTLLEHSYDWEFVPVAADSFRDSGSGECH
jgi:alkaline phosphatase